MHFFRPLLHGICPRAEMAEKCTFLGSLLVPRSALFLDRFRTGSLRMRRNDAESSLHMWRCGAEVLLDLSGCAVSDHQLKSATHGVTKCRHAVPIDHTYVDLVLYAHAHK